MAPVISGGFASTIFMLIKLVVHMRKNPVPWAVYTSPVFFLIAGTVCTLSIVYKGSPNLLMLTELIFLTTPWSKRTMRNSPRLSRLNSVKMM